jgi:superfamily I DNA/RNA helicase
VAWLGRTTTDGAPRDGETDFIVAHPIYGVLLIEVKGGGISYVGSRRQWISTDREGNEHNIDPFRQVVQCKYALRNKIKSLPNWSNRRINLGHAVAFPNGSISHIPLPPEAPADIIIDINDLQRLADRIMEIMHYWQGREKQPSLSGTALITLLERLLAPTINLSNPLSLQVRDENQEILRLTEEQFRTLNLLSRSRRAAISGCAGSGKTMLAVEKAKRLASQGFRTLLTCYNKLLAVHLREVTGKIDKLSVCNFHQLCYKAAQEARIPLPSVEGPNSQKIFDEDYPDALAKAVGLRPDLKYDAIIVDEGQDFKDAWWIALEDCLVEGKHSIFYVFYDDNQRIYRDRGSIPSDLPLFPLTENVRNTHTIHHALTTYYQGEFPSLPRGPVGRSVETHPCTTPDALKKLLQHILQKLTVTEQIAFSDIAVLTPRALDRSALREMKLEGNVKLVKFEEYKENQREILYSTIHSFKGLERPVAIVVELDEELPKDVERDALCYIAFSRPRSHLILLGKQDVIAEVLTTKN